MCWRHSLRKKDKVSHRVTENTEKEGKKEKRREGKKEKGKRKKGGKRAEEKSSTEFAENEHRGHRDESELKSLPVRR